LVLITLAYGAPRFGVVPVLAVIFVDYVVLPFLIYCLVETFVPDLSYRICRLKNRARCGRVRAKWTKAEKRAAAHVIIALMFFPLTLIHLTRKTFIMRRNRKEWIESHYHYFFWC